MSEWPLIRRGESGQLASWRAAAGPFYRVHLADRREESEPRLVDINDKTTSDKWPPDRGCRPFYRLTIRVDVC